MKNPFKREGFDCLISRGTAITGVLILEEGAVTLLDGTMNGSTITVARDSTKKTKATTLVIGGTVEALSLVEVENVTITGTLKCDTLIVAGQLAVKNGATVSAKTIKYRSLVVEPKALLNGTMQNMNVEPEDEPQETASK